MPDPAAGLVRRRSTRLSPGWRRGAPLVRGLFSGGTLCYESLVVLAEVLGPVYSNTPLDPALAVPAPPGAHQCLDLGEEEYTKGRPHPMIDPAARIELLRAQAGEPDVAAVLLDVVLGHGAHPDPAAELAPVCREITAAGGPRVVVYVLGTDARPAGLRPAAAGLRRRGLPGHRDRRQGLAGRGGDRHPEPRLAARPLGAEPGDGAEPRVALVAHSTKPRGGLVHTLSLAEALQRAGTPVQLIALGDPAAGLFRATDVPHTVLPAAAGDTLEQRVFAAIDTLAGGLADAGRRSSTCCTPRTASRPGRRPGSGTAAGPACGCCAPCTTSTTSPPGR